MLSAFLVSPFDYFFKRFNEKVPDYFIQKYDNPFKALNLLKDKSKNKIRLKALPQVSFFKTDFTHFLGQLCLKK